MNATSEQATPGETRATTGAYVYGVVRSGSLDAIGAEGVSGLPVEIVDGDGVAALVTDLQTDELRVRRRDLQRHLNVIEEAFAKTTILPCRFGTLADSRAGVRSDLLDARIVIASVDTYLRFAEAVNRLDLKETEAAGIEELRGRDGSREKARGVIEGVKDKITPGDGSSEREKSRS